MTFAKPRWRSRAAGQETRALEPAAVAGMELSN